MCALFSGGSIRLVPLRARHHIRGQREQEWSLSMRNVPQDAISTKGPSSIVQDEPDFAAASVHEPPAPAELFMRLGVMLVIALGFGLSAQCLVSILPR